MAEKGELGGRDLTKFWLYLAVIALCVAALLYMLLSAKPHIAPAVKDNRPPSSSMILPLPVSASLLRPCG